MRHELETQAVPNPSLNLAAGVVVGIDPGLDKHGVVALIAGTAYRLGRYEIPNTVAGMQFLVDRLVEWRGQGGGRLTIGIEEATAFGEAVECFLDQAGFKVLVVSALKVARFREVIQADANDLIDAEAVARFLMTRNVYDGEVNDGPDGLGTFSVNGVSMSTETSLRGRHKASVRPEDIIISREPPPDGNCLQGSISRVNDRGSAVYVTVNVPPDFVCLLLRRTLNELDLKEGEKVYITFEPADVNVFEETE